MKWAKLFVCATLLLAAPAWVAASEDDLDAELEIDVEDELDAEDDTTAHLVVRKWIPSENKGTSMVVGKSVSVKLEVFNAGSHTAYGVELKDSPWQGEATVDDVKTVGETTKRFATIEPGASVTMTYSLTAPAPGSLLGPPAQVTYRASVTEDKGRAGFSTGYSTRVISSFESAMDWALWAGTYGTLGVLQTKVAWRNTIVVAVLAAAALLANTLHKNHLESAKRRRQIKYEAEFMNSK